MFSAQKIEVGSNNILTFEANEILQNDILLHQVIPIYEERLAVIFDDFRDNKFRNIDYLDRFIKASFQANSEETCIVLQDKKNETEKILNSVNFLIQDLANIYKSSKKLYDFLGKSEKFCKVFFDGLFFLNFKKIPSVWYNAFYNDIFYSKNIFFHELLSCIFNKTDLRVFLDDYSGRLKKKKCFCVENSMRRKDCDIFENFKETLQNSVFFTYVFKKYFPLVMLRSWNDFLDPEFLFYNCSLGFVERFIEKIDLDQSLSITKIYFNKNQENINHDFFIIKFLDNFSEKIIKNINLFR